MSTAPLREALAEALPERPFRVELWDGSELPSTSGDGPVFSVRSPVALGHMLRAPGQLGLGRAYVAGALDVDDVDKVLALLDGYSPPPVDARAKAPARRRRGARRRAQAAAADRRRSSCGPQGRRHSIARDKRAVTHHYDVSNDFFELFLGDSMTYSCAVWSRGAETLEEAQETKLELVCTKLGLQEGERVLDVGCGWGSFAVHAAKRHGVHVTGITLSEPQAERARQRARDAGVDDRVEIRVMDYRELRGERFDAIASIGMVEHVGDVNIDAYAQTLADLLAVRRPAAQPRHRAAAPRRAGGRPVLRALRVPRRRAAAPVARAVRARARGLRDAARRGLPRGLRAHAARVDAAARRPTTPRR